MAFLPNLLIDKFPIIAFAVFSFVISYSLHCWSGVTRNDNFPFIAFAVFH